MEVKAKEIHCNEIAKCTFLLGAGLTGVTLQSEEVELLCLR